MTNVCVICGKSFEAKRACAKYCSKLCRDHASRPLKPLLDKVCVFCGKHFKTKMPKARCCSFTCCDRLRRGWESLEQYNAAHQAKKADYNRTQERDRNGLTLAQVQAVIDAQDGDPALLYERSRSWTPAQRKYARDRYQENHGLFTSTWNP